MLDKQVVRLEREKLPFEGKLDFLTCGGCGGIFPVSITEDEEGIKGFYKTSGFKRLSDLEEVGAAEVLTLLEKTIDAVEECGQYLIFPEEFVISSDTAYVDEKFRRIKFVYVPCHGEKSCGDKLIDFMEELKKITTDNGRLYLDMAKDLLSSGYVGSMRIRTAVLRLKHEIKICGIT